MISETYNIDCIEYCKTLENNSVDIILTDPPYKYLKNQKLETDFNEKELFAQWKRLIKKGGFIVLFGRGTSFYRWNYMLSELGFEFKEEIIWNKSHGTSPLMNLTRVHETISIFSYGDASINKVKIPYLEMKSHDIDAIILDVKRLKTAFNNTETLNSIVEYLENNIINKHDKAYKSTTVSSNEIDKCNRSISVVKSIKEGMNEKTIIRSDYTYKDTFTKHNATSNHQKGSGDRSVNVLNSIVQGMNEKSIIKEIRDHYTSIHPTQKPVRLLERLLMLVKKSDNNLVLDCFLGSQSTRIASYNLGLNFMGCELDKDYFEQGNKRFEQYKAQGKLF